MNRRRRARLQGADSLLSKALEIVDDVREEEQDSVDNCPENLQNSERYAAMEDVVSELEEARDKIQEALEHIDRACESG